MTSLLSRVTSTFVRAALSSATFATWTKSPIVGVSVLQSFSEALSLNQQPLLRAVLPLSVSAAGYKTRRLLKKRCPHCFFVQRGDRLFVECKVKPRHKQMQIVSKRMLFRED